MSQSTITSKYQTTVPRERQKLGLRPKDVLSWEVVGDGIRVQLALPSRFLRHRGSIGVGPGSVVEDIQQARALRGRGQVFAS